MLINRTNLMERFRFDKIKFTSSRFNFHPYVSMLLSFFFFLLNFFHRSTNHESLLSVKESLLRFFYIFSSIFHEFCEREINWSRKNFRCWKINFNRTKRNPYVKSPIKVILLYCTYNFTSFKLILINGIQISIKVCSFSAPSITNNFVNRLRLILFICMVRRIIVSW